MNDHDISELKEELAGLKEAISRMSNELSSLQGTGSHDMLGAIMSLDEAIRENNKLLAKSSFVR